MENTQLDVLHELASSFRGAIERARADRAPGALPYFPDGACRLTSRLLAQYLARRPDSSAFGHATLVSGVLPGSASGARHYWLEFGEVVVDLTADSFGQPGVIVGPRTSFHQSLTECTAQDARDALTALSPDETARLTRQLAAIEVRLPSSDSPAA